MGIIFILILYQIFLIQGYVINEKLCSHKNMVCDPDSILTDDDFNLINTHLLNASCTNCLNLRLVIIRRCCKNLSSLKLLATKIYKKVFNNVGSVLVYTLSDKKFFTIVDKNIKTKLSSGTIGDISLIHGYKMLHNITLGFLNIEKDLNLAYQGKFVNPIFLSHPNSGCGSTTATIFFSIILFCHHIW